MAGLVCYYNSAKFHYLYVSHDEAIGRHLRVMSALPDQAQSDAFTPPIAIAGVRRVELRVEVDDERLLFGYRVGGTGEWQLAAAAVRREHPVRRSHRAGAPNFTGAFVGMACQDMSGARCPADFDWFEYGERPYRIDPFGRDQ